MSAGPLVVTYPLTGRSRAIVAEELSGAAEAIYLVDLAPADRAGALGRAGAVLSHDTSKELRPDEIPPIRNARLRPALALAAAKRLFIEHANLKRGEFNHCARDLAPSEGFSFRWDREFESISRFSERLQTKGVLSQVLSQMAGQRTREGVMFCG
jgi:hypothetical protein